MEILQWSLSTLKSILVQCLIKCTQLYPITACVTLHCLSGEHHSWTWDSDYVAKWEIRHVDAGAKVKAGTQESFLDQQFVCPSTTSTMMSDKLSFTWHRRWNCLCDKTNALRYTKENPKKQFWHTRYRVIYLTVKHQPVHSKRLIAGDPVVPDPHPLTKRIIADCSCGAHLSVTSHLNKTESRKWRRRQECDTGPSRRDSTESRLTTVIPPDISAGLTVEEEIKMFKTFIVGKFLKINKLE